MINNVRENATFPLLCGVYYCSSQIFQTFSNYSMIILPEI